MPLTPWLGTALLLGIIPLFFIDLDRWIGNLFNGRYLIAPGWNDLRIPIAEIRAAPTERALDLANLSQMVIFTVDLAHPRRLYLDRVRLSRGGAP
jgi:hypothetical protein